MTDQVLIDMQGVGARDGADWLVRGVDLQVRRGEIVTLIGPNGSGKSTTAKIAVGVRKSDTGQVNRQQNLKIGYVPQKLAIDWTLPLRVARLLTLTGPQSDRNIDEALENVGISHLKNAEVQSLSGGEFQRALLARALLRRPDLLVLDEPTQGVDFNGEVAIYELIQNIRQAQNCGVLLISHDLHVVMAQTDVVLCLNGHVCCHGTPQSVVHNPEYLKLFGERAAESLAIYRHHHDHTHLPDGRVQHLDGSITDDCHPEDGHHHDAEEDPNAEDDKRRVG